MSFLIACILGGVSGFLVEPFTFTNWLAIMLSYVAGIIITKEW